MADILIRGMEMPCNAEGCEVIIRIQPNGEVLDAHKIHIGATAIPLPAGHGDLIDADAFCRFIANKSRIDGIIAAGIISYVNAAPIIVPAEGWNADG